MTDNDTVNQPIIPNIDKSISNSDKYQYGIDLSNSKDETVISEIVNPNTEVNSNQVEIESVIKQEQSKPSGKLLFTPERAKELAQRPRINRYVVFRNQLMSFWKENNGFKHLKELCDKNKKYNFLIFKEICKLCPKELSIDLTRTDSNLHLHFNSNDTNTQIPGINSNPIITTTIDNKQGDSNNSVA